jgi:uncharacterized protein (DUF1501 family)
MKRRDFIQKSLPAIISLPSLLNGMAVKAFASHPLFSALIPPNETDKVLVLIQLSGGNDGLNTVIPIEYYSSYFNARTNLAIPQNRILNLSGQPGTGLHPGMTGVQSLYNSGKMNIIQSVGYPNPNFSHFRATDIWMSASDSDENIPTGWTGRYLDTQYPGYPNNYPNSSMPDPLAIQIGSLTSLVTQGPSVNMGLSISDPSAFYNLVTGVQDPAPATPAGKELSYIRTVARQSNLYADAITDAYNNVPQQGTYPNTNLAGQLKIVARLIKGGLKTRVYMVNIGGFDTHSQQANTGDTTTGTHANLLTQLSDAMKAFQDDLQFLGIENRVLGMTFSEFGRRIKSNGSTGTDHGAAAPMFLFGTNVQAGITGQNPQIPASPTVNDNVAMQYDFRSVYASILTQWFCADNPTVQSTMLQNFQTLPLVKGQICGTAPVNPSGMLISNFPNPFSSQTTIQYTSAGGHTLVQIIDASGRLIRKLVEAEMAAGTYTVSFNASSLSSGVYYARLQNGSISQVRAMVKIQ